MGLVPKGGFCYLIRPLIKLPLTKAGGELPRAVAMTTVSKFIRVEENRKWCQAWGGTRCVEIRDDLRF